MKEVAIKEICTKGSSSLKQKELLPEGKYPVYGASGIAGYLDTFHQESNYIGIVKDGSGIGRVAFYPEKTSLIGTMQYILPNKGFNIRYIGYCLQSLDLSKYKQGAAIPHIYFRDYGERIVKVTDDVNEQLSIVSRLDAAFAHIDALKANAEKQLAEASQLFQAELTECMRPKEGWEEKRMEEVAIKNICSKVSSALKQKELLAKGKYPVYGASGLAGYMDNYHQENAYIGIVKDGSGIGRVAFYPEKTSLIGTMQYILPKKGFDIKYIGYCLQSLDLSKYKQGAAIPHIYFRDYGECLVKVTNDENEQHSIVSRLDALSANIKKLEEAQRKTLAECDALKQAMLREVFE